MKKLILAILLAAHCFGIVETEDNSVSYSTESSVLSYDIPFVYLSNTDIYATLDSEALAYGTDFSLSGGELTLLSAPEDGQVLYIYRELPYTQPNNYTDGDDFSLEELERDLDRMTMLIQQSRSVNTSGSIVRFPVSETPTTAYLPALSVRANKYLRFDSNGEFDVSTDVDLIEYVGSWVTATHYYPTQVFYDPDDLAQYYYVAEEHTSTTIASDLFDGKILKFYDLSVVFSRTQVSSVTIQSAFEYIGDRIVPNELDELIEISTDSQILNNYAAIVAPTVNDDSGDGYSVGSEWINTSNGNIYKCVSATAGAASWAQTNNVAVSSTIPTGILSFFPVESTPSGWLVCDGSAYNKATYPDLYNYLKDGGATCIYGEDATTFNVPDSRGRVVIVWDNGAGVDTGTRTDRGDGTTGDHVGTLQADQNKAHDHGGSIISSTVANHTHTGVTANDGSHQHPLDREYNEYPMSLGSGYDLGALRNNGAWTTLYTQSGTGAHIHNLTINSAGAHSHTATIPSNGGTNVQVKNIAFNLCIKI